jgi:hypothetical protein
MPYDASRLQGLFDQDRALHDLIRAEKSKKAAFLSQAKATYESQARARLMAILSSMRASLNRLVSQGKLSASSIPAFDPTGLTSVQLRSWIGRLQLLFPRK